MHKHTFLCTILATAARQGALDAERRRQSAEREAQILNQQLKERQKVFEENFKQIQDFSRRQQEDFRNHFDTIMKERMAEQQ